MSVITDEQRKAASLFYFIADREIGGFLIVRKDYWDEHDRLDDCYDGDADLDAALPRGFHNAAEAEWHYLDSSENEKEFATGYALLKETGFTELPNTWAADNDVGC